MDRSEAAIRNRAYPEAIPPSSFDVPSQPLPAPSSRIPAGSAQLPFVNSSASRSPQPSSLTPDTPFPNQTFRTASSSSPSRSPQPSSAHPPKSPQSTHHSASPRKHSSLNPFSAAAISPTHPSTQLTATQVVSPGRLYSSPPSEGVEHLTRQTLPPSSLQRPRRRTRVSRPAGVATLAMMLIILVGAATLAYSLKSLVRPGALQAPPSEQAIPSLPAPPEVAPTGSTGASTSPPSSGENSLAVNNLLTQEAALAAVDNWLKAKQEIFGPTYEASALEKVATGKFQAKALQSLEWLQQNKAYYSYRSGKVIKYTAPQENQMTLTIEEEVELLTQKGIDLNRSGKKVTTLTYTFEQVDGVWKIAGSTIE